MLPASPRTVTRFAYGFDRLAKPGDSITFAPKSVAYGTLAAAAYTYARRHHWRCSLETLLDGSIKVWRDRPLRSTVSDRRMQEQEALRLKNASRILFHLTSSPPQKPVGVLYALDLEPHLFTPALLLLREAGLVHEASDGTLRVTNPQGLANQSAS